MLLRIKVALFIIYYLLSVSNVALCKSIDAGSSHPGLYGNNDSLLQDIYGENLNQLIFDKKHASYVEFYNSFCGFCR
jgi:hypothetical protein